MNADQTWLLCVVGIVVFWIGGMARMYMVVRLQGWAGYLSSQKNLTKRYRLLIETKHAPRWPMIVSSVCLPLGVVIVFGAILVSKQ
jgi:hypothetical protein